VTVCEDITDVEGFITIQSGAGITPATWSWGASILTIREGVVITGATGAIP